MMKKYFLVILVLFLVGSVIAQPYSYNFKINTEEKKVESFSIDLIQGKIYNYNDFALEDYRMEIRDVSRKLLHELNFDMPFGQDKFSLYVPYFEDAHSAVIYDSENNEIDRILVSQYSKKGFDINDFNSNVILDEEVDTDEDKIVRKPVDSEGVDSVVVSLGVLLVLLVGLWVVLIRKKN